MHRWVRLVLVVVALAAVVALLKLVVFRPDPVPVTVHRAAYGRVEETVTNSKAGTVKSRRRASLSPAIPGHVAELAVSKGDEVMAGEILLRLEDSEHRAQADLQERAVQAARAAEREACLGARQAQRDLARSRDLAKEGVTSQQSAEWAQSSLDTAKAGCEAATAVLHQAEASLEVAEVNLSRTLVTAPFDGVVAEVRTEVGEWVSPSPPGVLIPAVLDLIDPNAIYVSAPLDEVDVGRIRVGQVVRVTLDPFPDEPLSGQVSRIAPYVEDVQDQNRTFEIEVELDDPGRANALLPGTTADVEVILREKDGALRIPSYALAEGEDVLVVRSGKLVSVPVKLGLRNWEFVEVVEGLEEGEPVVVSLDRAEVRAGARARITSETTK